MGCRIDAMDFTRMMITTVEGRFLFGVFGTRFDSMGMSQICWVSEIIFKITYRAVKSFCKTISAYTESTDKNV